MKVWIVSHFWDNGEKYREDLLEYQDYKIFSTYQKAMDYYCSCIIPAYIGQYILDEYEVDTHEVMQLEKSPWEDCPCQYPDHEPEYEPDESDYEENYDPYKGSYYDENLEKWRYGLYPQMDWLDYPEGDANPPLSSGEREEEEESSELYYWLILKETPIIREWLTHEGENYEIFEEIKKCEEAKLLGSLDRDLDALLDPDNITSGIYSISTPYTIWDEDDVYVHIKKWDGRRFVDFIEHAPFNPKLPCPIRIGEQVFCSRPTSKVEDEEVAQHLSHETYRHEYLDWQPSKLCTHYQDCE